MVRKIEMKNLTCSNCISKVERRTSRLPYVNSASFNYAKQILLVDFKDNYDEKKALKEITEIVDILEDNIITHYYEDKVIEKKINFFKEYKIVLIGMLLITITFFGFRIFPMINNIFGTSLRPLNDTLKTIFYWVGYVLLISKLLTQQIRGIKQFNIFNENTLMIIATLAAMIIGKYEESVAVVVLYSVGEYLQTRAVQHSRNEISALVNLKVDFANIVINNKVVVKDPSLIEVGDEIVVKNGERIPVDGKVISGSTSLNTSELTGETKLKTVDVGDDVLSGNINVGDVIHIEALKEYKNSTLAKIIDLIENSTNSKSKREMFITKFAKVYTPIVVGMALLLVIYGLIFDPTNVFTPTGYVYRAAIFLVISCPCSLVLSVPLAYYAGIGTAAKNGILFKGSTYLHLINDVETIALDKTGTLTYGDFFVKEYSSDEMLRLTASIERFSSHPIAKAIVEHNQLPLLKTRNVKEIPGYGISGIIDKKEILAGSRNFLENHNIEVNVDKLSVGSYTYVAYDKQFIGYIIVKDELKETSMETVREFTKHYDTLMLTGDNERSARDIAMQLGGIEYYAELLPEQKLEKFNEVKTNSVSLFVGDGINDAPLLKNADIGVSLGSATDLAIEVSDIIIIDNDIRLLDKAIKIGRKTKRISGENIIFSLVVKAIFLIMSTLGFMWMWLSIFADVGVAILCVLNALRIIYQKKYLEIKHKNKSVID
ncbi:heavy metal translocating P-type ATPase [Candidatus Izemoplasma sp. B36]|uniref:heavy metal translocating P-type ATPase n=1 Tax=Candidatus Izemoplasma sp. B36 TaxID=3242468 RepID=UPI0035562D51